ncbi:MAG: hypothetical protein JSV77_00255 [Dehalococcoidales bacterium]|nr:MAG: hypothetical protein JSV77_00255 [Dehalococcoidales bacterium]
MPADELYEENLPFPLATVATLVILLVALLMLILFILQLSSGPLGSRPAPDWFYLLMFIFMSAITFLVANFRTLAIRITNQSVTVAYGLIRKTILWGDIEEGFLDSSSPLGYGGWGARIARVEGRWRLAFNVIGASKVVLRLRKGRAREFMFSTKNPEQVLAIIAQETEGTD